MVDVMEEFNITQMVLEPTHQSNTLDLLFCFTSHPEYTDKTFVVPGMCLRDAVVLDLNIKVGQSNKACLSV